MKVISLSTLIVAGVLSAAPLSAAVESLKIEVTSSPRYSPSMQMDGVTEGRVIFAIAVDNEGKLTDILVLGYTHPGLVRACEDALKSWKITPARIDGVPVPAQTDVTIDFTAQGVVVSSTSASHIEQRIRQIVGPRMEGATCGPDELDRVPARVSTVTPAYAKDAEVDGVRGTVQVHFYIDSTGSVRMPAVMGPTHPYLAEAAVTAVRGWKFEPPTSRGKPVLIAARQDFNFGQ